MALKKLIKIMSIKKVCVIGSGVMGSAIAAQVANAKIEVLLLDLPSSNQQDRNAGVRLAKEKLYSQKPAPLSHVSNADFIKIGNLEDDLEKIRDVDLVIEVIVEKLDIKHQLYQKITPYLKNTALIASNTSTLPLKALNSNLSDSLKNRFYITHFFNPPRYLDLLELISPAGADESQQKTLNDFLTIKLGKTVIDCNDTPGFIANRIGCFFLEASVRKAINNNLNPEYIDQVLSKLFGFPSTGIFGLYDLIGHDVMQLISESLTNALDKSDKYHQIFNANDLLAKLRASGNIGRKSGAGFYKIEKVGDKKEILVLDLDTGQYRKSQKSELPQSLIELFAKNDQYAGYFREIFELLFTYSASLVPSVTSIPEDIDAAMRLGYALKYGPFELLAKMPGGSKWLSQESSNLDKYSKINFHTGHSWASYTLMKENDSAKLLSKDNRLVFLLCAKMGTLNANVFNLLLESLEFANSGKYDALYIASNASVFCAGADLRYFKEKIENKDFSAISALVKLGQKAMQELKACKIPVIAIAKNLALGGGTEILLHSDHVLVHQNFNGGLVEAKVGLLPGWGGTKEMFVRGHNNSDKLKACLMQILNAYKAESAEYFRDAYGVNCEIIMNQNLLLVEAFAKKYEKGEHQATKIKVPYTNLLESSLLEKYDDIQKFLATKFDSLMKLGEITTSELLEFEHDTFIELCHNPNSLARMSKFV